MTSQASNALGAELMPSDDFTALGTELMAADEAGDARRLADLAWQLYSEAGIARAETIRLHGLLRSLYSQRGLMGSVAGQPAVAEAPDF